MSNLSKPTAKISAKKHVTETQKFLSFRMGSENFGVEILSIKEILEFGAITEVPMMPEFVRGAINLRGKVVPVMDLAIRLGRKPQETTRRTCVVIAEIHADGRDMDIGIIVDAVNEVLDINLGDIEPAPSFNGVIRTDFLRGMGKIGEKFLIILNVESILSLRDLEAMSRVALESNGKSQ